MKNYFKKFLMDVSNDFMYKYIIRLMKDNQINM